MWRGLRCVRSLWLLVLWLNIVSPTASLLCSVLLIRTTLLLLLLQLLLQFLRWRDGRHAMLHGAEYGLAHFLWRLVAQPAG
jgi:hypothetical protein